MDLKDGNIGGPVASQEFLDTITKTQSFFYGYIPLFSESIMWSLMFVSTS